MRVNGNRVELPDGTTFVVTARRITRASILSRPRAAIVVTGCELVRGEREDRNGPFLAAEAVRLGLEPVRIAIVGDAVQDLEPAFREAFAADLCLVSGGLGPTHDDRTVELVARVAGRPLAVDEELERAIGTISRTIADRLGRPYGEFQTGVRKQATLPEGALSLGLAGTAPGLVLDTGTASSSCCRARPASCSASGRGRSRPSPVRRVLDRAPAREHHVLRFFGTPESAVAEALAGAGGEGDGVEVTICAREFEIHVDLFVEPEAEERGALFELAPHRARPVPLRRGRALDRGDRPRPLPRRGASRSRPPSPAPEAWWPPA